MLKGKRGIWDCLGVNWLSAYSSEILYLSTNVGMNSRIDNSP